MTNQAGPAAGFNAFDGDAVLTAAIQREAERGRHERLARRFALALADPDFRAQVYHATQTSPFPEGKVHLQTFLSAGSGERRHRRAPLKPRKTLSETYRGGI